MSEFYDNENTGVDKLIKSVYNLIIMPLKFDNQDFI